MCILALADDMTGALETGAKFRAAGIEAVVSAKPVATAGAQALVLDTETRHLNAAEARRVVREFVTRSGIDSPRLVYKKTDSTLRGNISAELESLAELYPDWRIGYAPAYPALGRTVKSGVLYVDGIPAAETEFASDALNPISTSSIPALLHPALPCLVFDGETETDLVAAARTILSDEHMRIAVEDLAAIPGRTQDLYLITKAGGFGTPDTLARVRMTLCPI